MQDEPIKKLESFANSNKQTQGKFTIGDEKVWKWILRTQIFGGADDIAETQRLHAARGRIFTNTEGVKPFVLTKPPQDPAIQKYTGKTNRVDVMGALREAKNAM